MAPARAGGRRRRRRRAGPVRRAQLVRHLQLEWLGLEVEACTEPDKATGWQPAGAVAGCCRNAAGAGNLGNGLRGNLGEWSMLRELSALSVVFVVNNPRLTGTIPALGGLTALQELYL